MKEKQTHHTHLAASSTFLLQICHRVSAGKQHNTSFSAGRCLNSISFTYLPHQSVIQIPVPFCPEHCSFPHKASSSGRLHTPLWHFAHELSSTLAATANQQRIAVGRTPQQCPQGTVGLCFSDAELRTWDASWRQPPGALPSLPAEPGAAAAEYEDLRRLRKGRLIKSEIYSFTICHFFYTACTYKIGNYGHKIVLLLPFSL